MKIGFKIHRILLPTLVIVVISIGFIQCHSNEIKPGRDYVEVGYYYSKSLRAWTVYLPDPNEEIARQVADKYLKFNLENDWGYNLGTIGITNCSVQFFDSLLFTPDWESYTLQLSDSQKKHQVGVFWYDHKTGEKVFEWIKKDDEELKDSLLPPPKITSPIRRTT